MFTYEEWSRVIDNGMGRAHLDTCEKETNFSTKNIQRHILWKGFFDIF